MQFVLGVLPVYQNLHIPPLAPSEVASDPNAHYEPDTMPVELFVQQPGRENLRVLHPEPRGYTTWFNKSNNDISRCINQMMYSMLRRGYETYSVMPRDEQEIWFRNFTQQFNWESGHTERVQHAFKEKVMESYTNTVYEWKVL
ncbi:unnamed protein product [Eruca vesicaria subsp. sativa]|uniref:Uncharacterized protein n=1 Tax=Eruca vesicaria subsp. sativa TaxID=29727 RepID=A0ABC8J481_ERUVS|nr:unnamed protein product [Eruca vesicaria subsp. sativa]